MTVAPDFGPYEYGHTSEWEQRTLAALQNLGHDATIGSGGVLDFDSQAPVAPTPLKPREHLFSSDSRLYGKFLDYCSGEAIDLTDTNPGNRPVFATRAHDFLIASSREYLAARQSAEQPQNPDKIKEALIPSKLVTSRLESFYKRYGLGLGGSDKVLDHLRDQALHSYGGIAFYFQNSFPEIRGAAMLTQSLLRHKHDQAAEATTELTAAYGMALSIIRKGPAQRPMRPSLDRQYGIPEAPAD